MTGKRRMSGDMAVIQSILIIDMISALDCNRCAGLPAPVQALIFPLSIPLIEPSIACFNGLSGTLSRTHIGLNIGYSQGTCVLFLSCVALSLLHSPSWSMMAQWWCVVDGIPQRKKARGMCVYGESRCDSRSGIQTT